MSYERTCQAMRLDEMIELPKSALVIYLHLVHLNRSFGKNGILTLSDRELQSRTHLPQQSITDAKRILKNKGFINFESRKGSPTRYQIPLYHTLNKMDQVEHQVEHQVEQAVVHPNITSNNNKLLPPPPASAYAIIDEVEDLTAKLRQITESASALEQRLRALKGSQVEHFDGEVEHFDSEEPIDSLVSEWESLSTFPPLDKYTRADLEKYLRQYGYDEIIAAMEETSRANAPKNDKDGKPSPYNGVSFKFFEKVLAGRHKYKPKKPKPNKKPQKEGEENVGSNSISYSAPKRDGSEPWRKYDDATEQPEQPEQTEQRKPWHNRSTA